MLLLVSRLLLRSLWCFFWSLLRSVLMTNSFVKRYWILNFIVIFACNERKIKMECCIRGVNLLRAFSFWEICIMKETWLLAVITLVICFWRLLILCLLFSLLYPVRLHVLITLFPGCFLFFNYYFVDCSFLYYNRLFQISRLLITPALSLLSLVMEELVLYYS